MSDDKHSRITAWSTVSYTLLTAGLLWVAWLSYKHPHGAAGEQSFSVPATSTRMVDGRAETVRASTVDFKVKPCNVTATLVSCVVTAVSPRYDRKLQIAPFMTYLVDNEGDTFKMKNFLGVRVLLDRDQPSVFKVEFDVNKEIVRPATVRIGGYIDNTPLERAAFKIK